MNSKIVILDDSVILYQHFISDDNWEAVMAFPRGGLTYLIKNDNIKFFAFEDYLYRNCLMTMDLPLYLIDESLGIDGEYDDIQEITEILNRIFPINSDRDLSLYLKKREAAELYQPSGNYFDDVEYDSSGKTIVFYSQGTLVDSIDARPFIKDGMVDSVTLIELSGDTYLHIVFNTDAGKEPIDIPLGNIFDADNYYTKEQVDALIPEVPSLDGYATETWVKNQGYINQLKTINNISLIGEGNIQIGSGGTIDAYTKAEADARFQPKGDYVTEATVIQYITNLQEQITNIIQTVSGCCAETGETQYRWITMTGANDYVCSGTTKMSTEKKQQSTDGINWTDVSPLETRSGSTVLEVNSADCNYKPEPQYRWKTAPASDYVCSGTSKYYKQYYEVSNDDGVTWQHVVPEQTRYGSLIEVNSLDCNYKPETQYRWYQAPASDYICSGTSKYYKEYYQVSTDGGQTWTNVTPEQTRQGSLIEAQSEDCKYESGFIGDLTYTVTSSTETNILKSQALLASFNVELQRGTYTDVHANKPIGFHGPYIETFDYTSTDAPANIRYNSNFLIEGSFSGTNIHTAIFYDGLTSMQAYIFDSCPYLEYIEIPSTYGGSTSWRFAENCPELKTVVMRPTTPPSIMGVPFANCPKLESIYVPDSSVNAYKNDSRHYWNTYASIIKPLSQKP